MELYTIQLAKHRWAASAGIKVIDTTVKSGLFYLAPTWDMVLGFKRGELTADGYTKRYEERMLHMYNHYRPEWDAFLAEPCMAIACYCSAGRFCHRHLLKDIVRRVLRSRKVDFIDCGEITGAVERSVTSQDVVECES